MGRSERAREKHRRGARGIGCMNIYLSLESITSAVAYGYKVTLYGHVDTSCWQMDTPAGARALEAVTDFDFSAEGYVCSRCCTYAPHVCCCSEKRCCNCGYGWVPRPGCLR